VKLPRSPQTLGEAVGEDAVVVEVRYPNKEPVVELDVLDETDTVKVNEDLLAAVVLL
jgi:hypothetical protein